MQIEDLVILRLPPQLATRLNAALIRHQHKRTDEKRKRKRSVRNAKSTSQVQESVWVDDDVPDNSDDEHAEHFHRVYESVVLDVDDDDVDDGGKAGGGTTGEDGDISMELDPDSLDASTEDDNRQFDFTCVKGREYVFRFGEEQYHATLVKLPCIVEAQKTFDGKALFKSGDIGQMLVVHDAPFSGPRPVEWTKFASVAGGNEFPHGLTPPMYNVTEQRFQRFSSTLRLEQAGRSVPGGLTWDDVKDADVRLGELRDLVVHRDRERHRVEQAKKKGRERKDVEPIRFVHEELIDAEPWMEWYPDDVIRIEEGVDGFVSSTEEAKRKALQVKKKEDEKLAQARAVQAQYTAAFGPSQDA